MDKETHRYACSNERWFSGLHSGSLCSCLRKHTRSLVFLALMDKMDVCPWANQCASVPPRLATRRQIPPHRRVLPRHDTPGVCLGYVRFVDSTNRFQNLDIQRAGASWGEATYNCPAGGAEQGGAGLDGAGRSGMAAGECAKKTTAMLLPRTPKQTSWILSELRFEDLSNPKPGHAAGGSGRGGARRSGVGQDRTGRRRVGSPRGEASFLPLRASRTIVLSISREARTSVIQHKSMEGHKECFTRGLSTVYLRDGSRSSFLAGDQLTLAYFSLWVLSMQSEWVSTVAG